jgi:hypothetical protein
MSAKTIRIRSVCYNDGGPVNKLLVTLAAVVAFAAAVAFQPEDARAARCGLPEDRTLWIDFADGSVPFWTLFAKPGVIAAAAQLIYPPQLRQGGAQTVYFDLYFRNRVGTSTAPADPKLVVQRANTFFDYAVQSTGCATPLIALNELAGPGLSTPWTDRYLQYRENVLVFMKTIAERGGRPFLLLPSRPYLSPEAIEWWREAAKHGDLVREVYFNAPKLYKQGPVLASRNIRQAFRRSAADLLAVGIPASRIGLMLGFQTARGAGGREGLRPASAWYETVKWQALAAAQVAGELRLASVWSWGWGSWSEQSNDGDKLGAACVYLWTRNPALCNAPGAVSGFDTSVSKARLVLPAGTQCLVGTTSITSNAVAQHGAVTGDREAAFTALYARAVESSLYPVSADRVLAAERAVVDFRFGGRMAAYRSALARGKATVAVARGVLADELRRAEIKQRLTVGPPGPSAIESFYNAYASVLTREVESSRAAAWLGGRARGLTLASLAPPPVFSLPDGPGRTVSWAGESYDVTLGIPRPLGALPLQLVRPAIAAQLTSYAKTDAYHTWTSKVQESALAKTACRRDALPQPGEVELTDWLPFLALS